jgi:peptidoglycan/LPS O-acetylase OafA/YrhL
MWPAARSLLAGSGSLRAWPSRGQANNVLLLRLSLALAVLVAHSVDLLMGHPGELTWWLTRERHSLGDFAVEGFMVLSGYLVAESWVCSSGVANFLGKRVLRVYPAFILACLVCVLLVAPLSGGDLRGVIPGRLALSTLLLQEPRVPGAMMTVPFQGSLDGSMWTISIEFVCYLGLAMLGLIGIFSRPPLVHIAAWAAVLFYGLGTVRGLAIPWAGLLVCFGLGAWMYYFRDRVPRRGALALVALALLVLTDLVPGPVFLLVLPFAWTYLVLWAASARPLRLPAWVARSDYSYGAYLFGWPVQQMLIRDLAVYSPPLLLALSLPLTLAAAALSWHGLERRVLALKQSRRAVGDGAHVLRGEAREGAG